MHFLFIFKIDIVHKLLCFICAIWWICALVAENLPIIVQNRTNRYFDIPFAEFQKDCILVAYLQIKNN